MRHMRRGIPMLGLLAVYLAAGATLDPTGLAMSLFGNAGLLSAAVLVVISALRRRREWAGCQRLFWDTVTVGMVFWIIGHVGWAYGEAAQQRPLWIQWHTVFSLSGGMGPLLALVARPHRGVRRQAAAAAGVDIASCGLFAGFLYSYFVLVPGVTREPYAEQALLVGIEVFRIVLMAGTCTAAVVARRTGWGPTYLLLAVGSTFGAILRALTSHAIAGGTYHIGTLYDAAWIVPFLFYTYAVWAAPASPEADEPDEPAGAVSFALLSAAPVLLIPVLGYAALPLHSAGPEGSSFYALLTGMATVVGLALLIVRLIVQTSELQRADARGRLLAAATEQTGDLILIARADGVVEHANDAFLRAVGLTRRDLPMLAFPGPVDPGQAAAARRIPSDVRASGLWRGTLRRLRVDGTTLFVSSTVVALRNANGAITHFVAVERDATKELELRDQLVQSERLSAVGELVAGVAHEINNPLQVIVGCVELLLEDRSSSDSTRKDLEIVRREADRAGHILRNLLSFVRHSPPDRILADLNDIVRHTADLREYHLSQQNIALVVQCSRGALPVHVDREEIQRVVLNLLLNAEHAILSGADRGTITLRTGQDDGGRQLLDMVDDGPGIRPELRGRIFEPFFTTKEVGQGTGLGLSISHGIAAAHGGALELCETTSGACFRLALPAYSPAAQGKGRSARGAASAAAGGVAGQRKGGPVAAAYVPAGDAVRVLVVDDEEGIRKLLARLLDRRGYRVAEAESVEEALAAVPVFRPAIVISDVRLPDGGGVDLYRRIRVEQPELARGFIFITGDVSSVELHDVELAGAAILAKPFTAADLDAQLARIVA